MSRFPSSPGYRAVREFLVPIHQRDSQTFADASRYRKFDTHDCLCMVYVRQHVEPLANSNNQCVTVVHIVERCTATKSRNSQFVSGSQFFGKGAKRGHAIRQDAGCEVRPSYA